MGNYVRIFNSLKRVSRVLEFNYIIILVTQHNRLKQETMSPPTLILANLKQIFVLNIKCTLLLSLESTVACKLLSEKITTFIISKLK